MFVVVIAIGAPLFYIDFTKAKNFEAEGVVVEAQWNTKNHLMSRFVISESGKRKVLHHHRVTLEPNQIKVGDTFKKVSGSKECNINGKLIVCVM